MAQLVINDDAVYEETFLPGQLFVFGSFALRANSAGRLEKIDSYAPGHQIRFGSLNYIADIRGDLIFEGFSALAPLLIYMKEARRIHHQIPFKDQLSFLPWP